jgi:hypothetical protein
VFDFAHETLVWSQENPWKFYVVVFLLICWLFFRSRERVEIARMRDEYNDRRSKSAQPPLPLTMPPKKPGGSG